MIITDEIGLVAWGLKLGKQVFFHSPFINTEDAAIVHALEDIRGVVNFTQPNIKFYSIEFSDHYRIYTVYRTIFDWVNREGYLAISLLVPHEGQLLKGRCLSLLDDLLVTYETKYIDDRHRIKNQREDPNLFISRIKKEVLDGMRDPDVLRGKNSNLYAYIKHANEDQLSEYFDAPYRLEYSEFKEIFFIPQNESRLRLSENAVNLDIPAKQVKYELFLSVSDDSNTYIEQKFIKILVNNQPRQLNENGVLSGLRRGEKVNIQVAKPGYYNVNDQILVEPLYFTETQPEYRHPIRLIKREMPLIIKVVDQHGALVHGKTLSIAVDNVEKGSLIVQNGLLQYRGRIGETIKISLRGEEKSARRHQISVLDIRNNDTFEVVVPIDIVLINDAFKDSDRKKPEDPPKDTGKSKRTPDPNAGNPSNPDIKPKSIWNDLKMPLFTLLAVIAVAGLAFVFYQMLTSGIQNDTKNDTDKAAIRLVDNVRDSLAKDKYNLGNLEKWKRELDQAKDKIDTSNRVKLLSNQSKVDSLLNLIKVTGGKFKEIDNFLQNSAFNSKGKTKLQSLEYIAYLENELKDNAEYKTKKDELLKKIKNFNNIEGYIQTYNARGSSIKARQSALSSIQYILNMDSTLTDNQRLQLKRFR